ncbi:MAG: hypothetical protein ABIS50_11595 [Luteolibacter sp.]|uniref:hypothetical protein n=1 Tax=Luteolibacter sp. TaxID=1962973 RepID=UPI0032658306
MKKVLLILSLLATVAQGQFLNVTGGNIGANGDAFLTNMGGTTAGKALFKAASVAAAKITLGLTVGADVQAYDADLTTYAGITPSANIQSFLAAANYGAAKTLLSLNNVDNTSDANKPVSTATTTALGLKVDTSKLSTTGGIDKVPQTSGTGVFRTTAVNGSDGVTPPAIRLAGNQRVELEDTTGAAAANFRLITLHGASGNVGGNYPEAILEAPRICLYWQNGLQIGDAYVYGSSVRSDHFGYVNPLQTSSSATTYPLGESTPIFLNSQLWDGAVTRIAKVGIQFEATGDGTGEVFFGIGYPGDYYALGSHNSVKLSAASVPFSIANGGPKIGTGKVLTFGDGTTMSTAAAGGTVAVNLGGTGTTTASLLPTGDWTMTQNSVPVFRSDATSAKTNTIRVTGGFVRVGPSQITTAAAYPFEVRVAAAGPSSGELYMDTNGTVFVGRLSTSPGDDSGKLVVQDREGTVIMSISAVTNLNTFGPYNVTSFQNVTDSTSSTTGAVKLSGGLGIVKSVYSGANIGATGYLKMGNTTVGSLAAAATAGLGATMIVTDSLTPSVGSSVAAGGSAKAVVTSNGTNWIVTSPL